MLPGFIEAMRESPGDDTPRLVAADFLEESDPERAVFIRVQVELAKVERGPCRCTFSRHNRSSTCARCKEADALRRRAVQLLVSDWACPFARPEGPYSCATVDGDTVNVVTDYTPRQAWQFVFRRGFVEEVRLPCVSWEAHGKAVYAAHPLTKVVLTDRTPYPPHGAESRRCFWSHPEVPGDGHGANIPEQIFGLLEGYDNRGASPTRVRWYNGRAEALEALSSACLRWAGKEG